VPVSSTVLFASLALGLLADVLLSATWFPPYFRAGLPIYRRTFPAQPASELPLPDHELESAFESGFAHSIAFRTLSPRETAFREQLLQVRLFGYNWVMHGLLTWDYAGRQIRVTGFANWFPTIFFTIVITMAIAGMARPNAGGSASWPLAFVGAGAILLLTYRLHAYTFNQIGNYASRRWSELQTGFGADA
jgi:hypothetical protein